MTDFTPLQSLLGGGLIGLAAVLLMLMLGRVYGTTGILAGLLQPTSRSEFAWRAALVVGMMTGPSIMMLLTGEMPKVQVPVSTPSVLIGGFVVGLGVVFGSGCTSGHGICGNARLSPRSMVATATFMLTCGLTVYIIRHVIGA